MEFPERPRDKREAICETRVAGKTSRGTHIRMIGKSGRCGCLHTAGCENGLHPLDALMVAGGVESENRLVRICFRRNSDRAVREFDVSLGDDVQRVANTARRVLKFIRIPPPLEICQPGFVPNFPRGDVGSIVRCHFPDIGIPSIKVLRLEVSVVPE